MTSRERKALLRYADWWMGRKPYSREAHVIASEIIHDNGSWYVCDGFGKCAAIAESLAYDGRVVK